MPPKKKKNTKSVKKEKYPEEIPGEERLEQLGIFEDDEEYEDND